MILSCPHCGSTDVDTIEIGDGELPDVYECDACGEQFEDPDHELSGA